MALKSITREVRECWCFVRHVDLVVRTFNEVGESLVLCGITHPEVGEYGLCS